MPVCFNAVNVGIYAFVRARVLISSSGLLLVYYHDPSCMLYGIIVLPLGRFIGDLSGSEAGLG